MEKHFALRLKVSSRVCLNFAAPLTVSTLSLALIIIGGTVGGVGTMAAANLIGISPLVAAGMLVISGVVWRIISSPMQTHRLTWFYSSFGYQGLAISASTFFLVLFDKPVLSYLDLLSLWFAITLAAARINCLLRGCCHGRPNRFGVIYEGTEKFPGLAVYYVGVRLFPLQLVQAIWNVALAMLVIICLSRRMPTGTAFSSYLAGYCLAQFYFEFLRGDARRYFVMGFSEAQWISILAAGFISAMEVGDLFPTTWWHLYSFLAMASSALAVALFRQGRSRTVCRIRTAAHMAELAEAVRIIEESGKIRHTLGLHDTSERILAFRTSAGLQLAGRHITKDLDLSIEYVFSFGTHEVMSQEIGNLIADNLIRLTRHKKRSSLKQECNGAFHLIIGTGRLALS
jgi:hypothetical protein